MTFLTIAIPTYNRVNYLKELLPELLRQCAPYPEIEITVSNNCSTDDTADYLATVPRIQTWTNVENVGAAENFVRCVESAQGDYVWLFGDDDLIEKDGIDNVMDTLRFYPVSLLIVGIQKDNPVCFRSSKEFINGVSTELLVHHTLITCNIFKKELFVYERARRYWRNYGAMRTIMRSLEWIGGKIYLTNLPVIKIRENRAPFNENTGPIRIMQLSYLRYLGLSYTRIISYIYTGILLACVKRRIYNWKCRRDYRRLQEDDRVL
jgi:glycosyltransferase involved in cell wall biosynthesis